MPLPHNVVVVVDVVVVVEAATVVVVVLVVLVVVVAHPLGPHASQQLGFVPIVDGGLQRVGSRLTLQCTLPSESVRQQVTKPGLPHVERDAQRTTLALQPRGSLAAFTSPCAACDTHFTYWPWVVAVAQLHCASATARAAQTAAGSSQRASAPAGNPAIETSRQATPTPPTLDLMRIPPLPVRRGRLPTGLPGTRDESMPYLAVSSHAIE